MPLYETVKVSIRPPVAKNKTQAFDSDRANRTVYKCIVGNVMGTQNGHTQTHTHTRHICRKMERR